jgi:hypothetical protein
MDTMKTIIYSTILSLFLGAASMAQHPKYKEVNFCDLARQPETYRGRTIKVTAVYRYGFEWSELYCLECLNSDRIWVDFDDSSSTSQKRISPHGSIGRTVQVVLIGRIDDGGGYGHMGAYRFRLLVNQVVKSKVLLNDSPSPNSLPIKVVKKMNCQTRKS